MSDHLATTLVRIEEVLRGPFRLFGLRVYGVEVTQAIQYFDAQLHLTDPADRGADNSIRLVADKPACVRVYVRNRPNPLVGVTATVTMQRRRYGIFVDAGTLTPLGPASVTAEPDPPYAAERGSINATLNFLIPAAAMRGAMRLRVAVRGPAADDHDEMTIDIDASLLQTLRVRGIPVRYWGPDAAGNQVQLAAPTLADFQAAASLSLQIFPVSQTPDIGLAGIFTQSEPLTGAITTDGTTSFCPTSWNNLLFWLGIAKVIDGNRTDRLYYALLPSDIPIGGAGGCGGGGSVSAGRVGRPTTMAHELGHVLGLAHAPCGLATGDMGDPNYPAYEPYDAPNNKQGTIGEYGLDVSTRIVYSPAMARDVMSYCGPAWISPYHYRALVMHSLLDPRWVPVPKDSLPPSFEQAYEWPIELDLPYPPPWEGRRVRTRLEADPTPLVIVTGVLQDDQLEIRSVWRLRAGASLSGRVVEGTRVELLGHNNQVLSKAPLRRVALHPSCGCGCAHGDQSAESGLVQVLLSDREDVATIRVIRGEDEIWTRSASSAPPLIGDVAAELDGETLYVRWHTSTGGDPAIERAVRWSADAGQTWQSLAIGLQEDRAELPVGTVMSGSVLVQVLVSDGFHTAIGGPVTLDVPRRAPEVAILWPAQGAVVASGEPVRLWGIATACDAQLIPEDEIYWELDGQRVGTGREVWADHGNWEGEHRATLHATDGAMTASRSVTFTVTCTGRRPVRLG